MLQKCLSLHANFKKNFLYHKIEPNLRASIACHSQTPDRGENKANYSPKILRLPFFFFVEDTVSISDRCNGLFSKKRNCLFSLNSFLALLPDVSAFETEAICNIL